MIPIPDKILCKMTVLAGAKSAISNEPVEIFTQSRIDFLARLSRRLLTDASSKAVPEVVTFAYWCRQSNLERLRLSYLKDDRLRMGLGLSFHICPSNVPINFAFSMAFGLLSGNSCVLRLPSKPSAVVDILVKAIQKQLDDSDADKLYENLALLRFERDDETIQYWMSVSDGRIVWGGDETVAHMRSFPSKPRSREVAFADRYSLCLLNAISILQMEEITFNKFCNNLFNDIYLMDQAACSSPQLIAWIGNSTDIQLAQSKLWPEVVKIANNKYSMHAVQVMDKFVQACRAVIAEPHLSDLERHDNVLYRMVLSAVDESQDTRRGYFGTIHEVLLPELDALAPIVNERYQTMTVQGVDQSTIREWLIRHRLRGIDRIVPVGRALDMNVLWDGFDLIGSLSRIIDI